jgi:hypothetical protein
MRFHKIFPALSETAVSLPARSPLGENILMAGITIRKVIRHILQVRFFKRTGLEIDIHGDIIIEQESFRLLLKMAADAGCRVHDL